MINSQLQPVSKLEVDTEEENSMDSSILSTRSSDNAGSTGNSETPMSVDQRNDGCYGQACGSGQRARVLSQTQMLTSAQASKQMVYEVFGNCVKMLKEMEHLALKQHGIKTTERSDIGPPDQSKLDITKIEGNLNLQLCLLKAQLVSCNGEIKHSVKEELKKAISHLASGLIPNGATSSYAGKMIEMLDTVHTVYSEEFGQPSNNRSTGFTGQGDQYMPGGYHGHGDRHRQYGPHGQTYDYGQQAHAQTQEQLLRNVQGAIRVAKANPKMSKSVDNHRTSWR